MAERIDMVIPETFHRVKRTVLLFSAALIVLELAVPAKTATVHLTIIDVDLSAGWMRSLLLGALAYYTMMFLAEVDVARRLNTAMFDKGSNTYPAAMERLGTELGEFWGAAGPAKAALEVGMPHLVRAIELVSDREKVLANRLADRVLALRLDPALGRDAKAQLAGVLDDEISRHFGGQHQAAEITNNASSLLPFLQNIEKKLGEVEVRLDRSHRDMTRLSAAVIGSRRISFLGLEVTATLVTAAIATLVTANSLLVSAGWVLWRY